VITFVGISRCLVNVISLFFVLLLMIINVTHVFQFCFKSFTNSLYRWVFQCLDAVDWVTRRASLL